jgi:hypothetical protein
MSSPRLTTRLALKQRVTISREAAAAFWERASSATVRGSRKTAEFARKADPLSAARPVSGISEALLLTSIPLLTFLAVLAFTGIAGVSYQPHCNSASNFLDSLLLRPGRPSTCKAVPFLSDIPTIILSVTCPFALVAYRLIRRRIGWLVPAVVETGLVSQPSLKGELSREVDILVSAVDLNLRTRLTLLVVTVAMTTWLYVRNLFHGHLFTILSRTRNGVSDEAALRASWWANYHFHPLLAVVCVSIGSMGVYYALRTGWLNFKLAAVLVARRKARVGTAGFDYVPRWKDQSYGWSPVTGALFLIYMTTVNFAASMVAVWDMLQNTAWTIIVAAFFVTLGIACDLAIIITSFIMLLRVHEAVRKRLRDSLVKGLEQGSGPLHPAEYTIAASDLTTWRRIPVASLSGTALKVVPGAYAFVQFAVKAFFVRH